MKKIIFLTALVLSGQFLFAQVNEEIRLGLPLGHNESVNTAAYSPNGKLVITASDDGTVKVWDAFNGRLVNTIPVADKQSVNSATFSPDSKSILTASSDYKVKLIDIESNKETLILDDHYGKVNTAVFSHDGKKILSASDDNTAKVWDSHTGALLFTIQGHKSDVNYAEFSLDDKRIITASNDKTAKIWDAENGKLIHTFKNSPTPISIAKYSADGKRILTITSYDKTVKIYDAQSYKLLFKIDTLDFAFFSSDGKDLIFQRTVDWDVSKIDIENGIISSCKHFESAELNDKTVYSPDGNYILTPTLRNSAVIYESNTGRLINRFKGAVSGVNTAIFNPHSANGTISILTGHDNGDLNIWNMEMGKILHRLNQHKGPIISAAYQSDVSVKQNKQNVFLTGSTDGTAKIWDAQNGSMLHSFEASVIHNVEAKLSPDGLYVLTVERFFGLNGTIKLWNTQTGNLICTIESEKYNNAESIEFSPPIISGPNIEPRILISLSDGTSIILDAKTGKKLYTLGKHSGSMISANFSNDGNKILTVSSQNVKIWDAANGKLLHDLKVENGGFSFVDGAIFSNDGKMILIVGPNKASVWNAESGEFMYRIDGYFSAKSIMFSPDGSLIFSIDNDSGSAKIWDSRNGKLLEKIQGEKKYLVVIATFSKNGRWVYTQSNRDKSAKIWCVQDNLKSVELTGHFGFINSSEFSPFLGVGKEEGKFILTASDDGSFILWETSTGKKIVQQFVFDKTEPLSLLSSGHYMATQKAASKLYYVKGLQTISFDQFDIKYNRPDKVLLALGEAFGNPDTVLIRSFHHAWLKRVQKLGIDTTSFEDGFSVPESDFLNRAEIKYEQKDNQLTLKILGKDSDYPLDRYNVWVNEVPVFGQRGVNVRDKNLNELHTSVTLTLSEGDNKIETSVLNVNGIESYRVPLYVRYNPSQPSAEKLYFVGIGVDRYQQPGHDLKYSVKDIRDLSKALKNKYGNNIEIDTLFDEQVTRENVLALKKKLKQTTVNDKVIISFSGHGLLDSKFDYYLATHAVDFKNPSENGLPYEDLEWLLDSIPARKKLLLLDACHSGELDKEELLAIEKQNEREGAKGPILVYQYKPTVGMKNSFELMQELFANVSRGTGATVISAAGGTQFAFEKNNLANGVFTYSILELMEQTKEMKVSELKIKVGERVTELTNGLQRPTSRNETLEFDWRVW